MNLLASMVLASQQPVATVSIETGNIIISMATGVLILLVSSVGYLIARTLKQTSDAQEKLFDKLDTLSEDYYTLKGEHKARTCNERSDH